MTQSLLQEPIQSYEDSNGRPLNGGQLFTYSAGTLTPKATYQDQAGATPNTNPVILSERGEAIIYGSGNYRMILKNSAGATIFDRDNVPSFPTAAALAGDDGASLIGFDGTTLNLQFKSRVNRVVDSIAALRSLDKNKYTRAFVSGYTTAGDGGGGDYWLDASDTTSADNQGTIIVASDGARWKFNGTPTVKTFGAKGDGDYNGGGTNDTAAINACFAATPLFGKVIFPHGCYNVTSLTWTGSDKEIEFHGAMLYGVATTVTDALLTLSDFAAAKITGLQLRTDGNKVSPSFHGNYACALRIISSGAGATQFVRINSLKIWYFRQGIINGAHVGSPPQPSATQSEIWIDDFQVRGVNRPFYGNLINSYVVFTNSGFIPQQFEASASWWVDADGWCARNDDGRSEVLFIGCEFQRAIQSGFALYGIGMAVVDPIWEVSCPTFVAGDMTLRGGINNFFGAAAIEPFQVTSFATGVLTLDGFNLERPAGTADFDRTVLVNAQGNNNIRVKMHNLRLKEWAFSDPNGSGDLVRGGRLKLSDVFIDNSTGVHPSFELDTGVNILTNIDRVGVTFPLVGDTAPHGGWSVTAGAANGAYAQFTTTPPPGASCWLYATTNPVGGFTFESSGSTRFAVQGGRDYVLDMWLKSFGFGAGGTWQCIIEWQDYAGTSISSVQVMQLDATSSASWNAPQRYRAGCKAPWQAGLGIIRFTLGPNTTVGVNDILMY